MQSLPVGRLVEDYLALKDSDTEGERQIEVALGAIDPKNTLAHLQRVSKRPENIRRIAKLTLRLGHPDAWDILSDHVNSSEYSAVVDALLELGNGRNAALLVDRWFAMDPSLPVCDYIGDALKRKLWGYDCVTKLVEITCKGAKISDSWSVAKIARFEKARKLVREQMGVPEHWGDGSVMEKHKQLQEKWKILGKKFPGVGIPIRLLGGLSWGENKEYDERDGVLIPVHELVQGASHELVIHMQPMSADDCEVGYSSTQGVWSVSMMRGEGRIISGDRVEHITDAKVGSWSELRFVVRSLDVRGEKEKERRVDVYVGGKRILSQYMFNGTILGVYIRGRVVVGGCSVKEGAT